MGTLGIRLIATDLDGTLLRDDETIGPRTLAALVAARDAGVRLLPISGRQPFSIHGVLAGTPLVGHAAGSNGAIVMDLVSEEVLFEDLLAPPVQAEFVRRLKAEFPDVRCVSVRDQGRTFVPERGYLGLMDPGDHGARADQLHEHDLDEVLAGASLKLVVRQDDLHPDVLLDAARRLGVPGCTVTTSGAPFVEVSAAGVTKAAALARYCARYGIAAHEVMAFGDNRNDADMVSWAGVGVAVANALPEVLAVADEVTASNNDDGVGVRVERLLATGR